MFEKVNPSHPDKIADRIAGAIVDLAYTKSKKPKVAIEVLIGHGIAHIISETSERFFLREIEEIVRRISGITKVDYKEVKQDAHLAQNQSDEIRCGDNGIFKGTPITGEQKILTLISRDIYDLYPHDGKYIFTSDEPRLIICQSNSDDRLKERYPDAEVNPIGDWTGGTDVDTGATNRKLGSDMGDAVTGGGLHGKDLSKADVSVNIYAHLLAQEIEKPVMFCCAIGDKEVGGVPYSEIVKRAKRYIDDIGGFEKLAEWGLIR